MDELGRWPMTLNEYQAEALRTMNTPLGRMERLSMLALGLAGESGEVADHIKKIVYHGHEMDDQAIHSELGDVLWYLACLARECGFTLDRVAVRNVEKLRARYPDGFSKKQSRNRQEQGGGDR